MSNEETAARYRQVLAWRDEGLSYRVIGERLGVGTGRASDLHRAALRWQQRLSLVLPPTTSQSLTADMPLDVLPIAARAKTALHRCGLRTVGEVTILSDAALRRMKDIGPLTVATIRSALATKERSDV